MAVHVASGRRGAAWLAKTYPGASVVDAALVAAYPEDRLAGAG